MNKELSIVLRDKLVGLPFVDMLGGMVQTVTTEDANQDNEAAAKIVKKFPVTYDIASLDCQGKETAMVPDSSKKSIIYFEDFGLSVAGRVHGQTMYSSSLRLICWMNKANLVGNAYVNIGGRCMATIVDILAGHNPENVGMFTRMTVNVARIPPQDAGLFGRYTYNEADRQYLRPPFEFFGIDFIINFQVPSKCLSGINFNLEQCT
jgi:hypothetical protein